VRSYIPTDSPKMEEGVRCGQLFFSRGGRVGLHEKKGKKKTTTTFPILTTAGSAARRKRSKGERGGKGGAFGFLHRVPSERKKKKKCPHS